MGKESSAEAAAVAEHPAWNTLGSFAAGALCRNLDEHLHKLALPPDMEGYYSSARTALAASLDSERHTSSSS